MHHTKGFVTEYTKDHCIVNIRWLGDDWLEQDAKIVRLQSDMLAVSRTLGYPDDALALSTLDELLRDTLAGVDKDHAAKIVRLQEEIKQFKDGVAVMKEGIWQFNRSPSPGRRH